MRFRLGTHVLLLAVGACGGRVGSSDHADVAGARGAQSEDGANQGGANQGGANQGGANQGGANQGGANQGGANQGGADTIGSVNAGGTAIASGGTSQAVGCNNALVTFVVMPPSNTVPQWCMGKPRGCQYVSGSIRDASGYLNQSNLCSIDCETCEEADCHSIICLGGPNVLTAQGITSTWNGSYYRTSACGSLATRCSAKACASPGQYSIEACGFINPNPTASDGCSEATESTPVRCVQVVFNYPTDVPVVIRMPDE